MNDILAGLSLIMRLTGKGVRRRTVLVPQESLLLQLRHGSSTGRTCKLCCSIGFFLSPESPEQVKVTDRDEPAMPTLSA